MENEVTQVDKTLLSNQEIADLLKIGSSTLRKWCLALEKDGYVFKRDENNMGLFNDKDSTVLCHGN